MSQRNSPLLVRHKTSILVCTGIAIILLIAGRQWDSIEAALTQMAVPLSLVALLSLVCANVIAAMQFAALASNEGGGWLERTELSSVFLVSQAAKYVPGKVWSILMQAAYLRGRFSAGKTIVANIEIALMILGVVSIIGVGIAFWVISSKFAGFLIAVVGILVTLLAVRRGPLRRVIFRTMACLTRKGIPPQIPVAGDDLDHRLSHLYLGLITFAIFYLGGWLIFAGPALGIEMHVALRWVGLMSLSYVLGTLSMFPAGLGIREATIYILAAYSGVDPHHAASIAVLSRIMMLAIDVTGILIGSAALFTINAVQGRKR